MRVGLIGLGRMGHSLALNLLDNKISVVAFDNNTERVDTFIIEGGEGVHSLEDLVAKLDPPRVLMLMIPAGHPVDETLKELSPLLEQEDAIIDGGNSFYKDSQLRFEMLKKRGIHF